MTGRTLLAFGILVVGTLGAAPASACSDDRFACATTSAASSETRSSEAATPSQSQRGAKVRGVRKRLGANLASKKTARRAARAGIIQPARSTPSRTAAAKRSDERAQAEPVTRTETSVRPDPVRRIGASAAVEAGSRSEPLTRAEPVARPELAARREKSSAETVAARYDMAGADPSSPVTGSTLASPDLLSPVPIAGATEIFRLSAASDATESEQLPLPAPIVAASEPSTAEFKSDPARLFTTPAVASERVSPRKNAPSGLSWIQAVLLSLGGGIVAVSTFKLFSCSKSAA
jgi:hypothetical protein